MKITGGKVFDLRKGFVERDVCFDGALLTPDSRDGQSYDAAECYVIPGLTDVHFHGCVGADLSDGDGDGLQAMAKYELSRGVTQICPAGMTLLEDRLMQVCRTAAEHNRGGRPGADLVGINLEGPFLSYAKKGAQNGDWLHAPDVAMLRRLEEASEGLVKLVSVAPEEPGAMEFIKEVAEEVAVSVAHTTADYDTALEAFRLGAREVTHLFNAMPGFTHRAPGVVGAALDSPWSRVELICDGLHIHPSVIRLTRQLFGKKLVIISDSLRCAGMPDGQYELGGQPIEMKNGKATLLGTDTLAGSSSNLLDEVRNVVSFGLTLEDAIYAVSQAPAQAVGLKDVGVLEAGKRADLLVLDGSLNLGQVYIDGNLLGG